MSLKINFDRDWSCCRGTTTDSDNMIPLAAASAINDLDWSAVQLPHIAAAGRETTIDNKREKWWYRKQFRWILSNQQVIQPICLSFESSDNYIKDTDDTVTSPISAIVWFNAVKIFSGTLRAPQTLVELTQSLLNSDQVGKYNDKHTLIVCCMNGCLSFNTFLTVPHDLMNNVREIQLNEAGGNTTSLSQKHNDMHCYVASFNDIDERVNDFSDAKQSSSHKQREFSNTVTDTVIEEIISGEKIQAKNHLGEMNHTSVPLLTIVMLIVGTRGDVQPFIAYGKALRAAGHRVRLATHEKFRKFVRDNGLEFFPLGGDPTEIMSFMVQNSGIIPSFSTIIKGDLFRRRRIFSDILESTWLACTSDDDETGAPFRAEAIIANPISYGHIHCAQKLGIHLHMAFTMPSSPTTAFPHPLSSLDYSKEPRERLNIYSYSLVEILMWLGIGDLINKFRRHTLDLLSLHIRQATSIMIDEKVPFTYCWSPSLVPKPPDWPFYIDVSGYFFLDLATNYTTPPNDLLAFLGFNSELNSHTEELSPPIFIGFGSITGHDSDRLLKVILDALMQTGYRALLFGFDINADDLPKTIFKIDDVPFDWLFQHVSAVCHHGGAGTTAVGLHAGKPTIVIPFFGDQFFWGSVVQKSGAGPPPLPGKDVTVEELVEAFKFVHNPAVQDATKRVQEAMSHENGCAAAVRAFHANLPVSQMRSDLESTYAACFRLDEFNLQVSRPVAQVLLSAGLVDKSQFRYHSTRDWQLTHDDTSESHINDHPRTADFQLYATTVTAAVYYGLKNDTNNSMNKTRAAYRRRRSSISAVGALIAGVNSTLKPAIGTLLSATAFNPNKDTSAKTNPLNNTGVVEQTTANTSHHTSTSLSTSIDDSQQHDSNDISVLARNAASVSGYSPDVCKHILLEFNKLKRQRVQMPTFSLMKHEQPHLFALRRTRSFTDLNSSRYPIE